MLGGNLGSLLYGDVPVMLKLVMDQSRSTISINDDPGLTLTYFTARPNFVKIAYCSDTRPRCQVSIYRTIGPLVFEPA